MSISKIKEIFKKFDEKYEHEWSDEMAQGCLTCETKNPKDCDCQLKEIKSFYTQQILSLIEELIGEDEKHNYSSQGSTQTKKMDARNAFRREMRASIKSFLK